MNAQLHPTLALAMLSMAPPSSVVHQIVSEDRALQADLEILRLKQSGEFDRRRYDQAMRLQQAYQDGIGRTL